MKNTKTTSTTTNYWIGNIFLDFFQKYKADILTETLFTNSFVCYRVAIIGVFENLAVLIAIVSYT